MDSQIISTSTNGDNLFQVIEITKDSRRITVLGVVDRKLYIHDLNKPSSTFFNITYTQPTLNDIRNHARPLNSDNHIPLPTSVFYSLDEIEQYFKAIAP